MINPVLLSFVILVTLAMLMIFVPGVRRSKFLLVCIGTVLSLVGVFILHLIFNAP